MSPTPPQSSSYLKMTCSLRSEHDNKDVTTTTIVITRIIKSCCYYQWCKNIYFHQKNTTNLQEESTMKLENMVSSPPSVDNFPLGVLGVVLNSRMLSPASHVCVVTKMCMKDCTKILCCSYSVMVKKFRVYP